MTEQNDALAEPAPILTSPATSMRVCFQPSRDTSRRAFVSSLLLFAAYAMASTILFLYVLSKAHGAWFLVASLGQLVLHFYMTTEILHSRDEVERLVGYALLREEGLVRFCGYAPGRRRLRTLGAPIRSIEEVDAALHVRLYDGSHVQLPKLSLEGQRMFKRVFESMSTGADAETLRSQYAGLAPGLLATLEYKEAPQLPKWQYWVSAASMISAVAAGWKLHAMLFG
jgi:hypothetical protein